MMILIPSAEPASIPGDVDAVVNLRGARTPPYDVPPGVRYIPAFVRGGPRGWATAPQLDQLIRRVGRAERVVIHCQHGQNRTGLLWWRSRWPTAPAKPPRTLSGLRARAPRGSSAGGCGARCGTGHLNLRS